ncbi:MAG: guanylate kinase [Chitinophagales bacterium]|nr:guanylate kinase [Chitinophagales bacterium]MCZ2393001.1 guanylate kinase [Chitinophagales bacterium]
MPQYPHHHKAIIFTGPSGGGKTTLSQHILKTFSNIKRSVSATTRLPRNGEIPGYDYQFFTNEIFKYHIENNDFIEWEQVYDHLFYGTLKSEVERIWNEGKIVLFVVDVIGSETLKKYFGENAIKIFVKTPSLQTLKERLEQRGTECQKNIANRIRKAEQELLHEKYADIVIVNDDLEEAKAKTSKIISTYIHSE